MVKPALASGARLGPRVELQEHVLQAGARPGEDGGVGVDDVAVLRIDVHLDLRDAVLQADRADLADLHSGDPHRLALPGRERLARSTSAAYIFTGEDCDEREAQPLLVEDVAGDEDRQQQQPEDRREVGERGCGSRASWVRRGGRVVLVVVARAPACRRRRRRVLVGAAPSPWQASSLVIPRLGSRLPSTPPLLPATGCSESCVRVVERRDRRLGLARHRLLAAAGGACRGAPSAARRRAAPAPGRTRSARASR